MWGCLLSESLGEGGGDSESVYATLNRSIEIVWVFPCTLTWKVLGPGLTPLKGAINIPKDEHKFSCLEIVWERTGFQTMLGDWNCDL